VDQTKVTGIIKYMITGGPRKCISLLSKWTPEAASAAKESLKLAPEATKLTPRSCASEVAMMMGATDEEMVTVAGFAGGLGLSGNACGALAPAGWLNTLPRTKDGKSVFFTPESKKTLKAFKKATGNELLCHKICGRRFKNLDEHSEFMESGGCKSLLEVIAKAV
jgi:hypothetical protein